MGDNDKNWHKLAKTVLKPVKIGKEGKNGQKCAETGRNG